MARRIPLRLVRLLAVACALLVPVAAAQAAPPANDVEAFAQVVAPPGWTSLSAPQNVVVQATDWGDATTGPEDANPLPSCTGSVGFRSIWYQMSVPEAAVLRVTVLSTDPVRYQPVVSVLDSTNTEVGCGLANDVRLGATANATAYVTPDPITGMPQTYLIRVAEVTNNSPVGGLPMLTVSFAAKDVTAPQIKVVVPSGKIPPKIAKSYDATGTTDLASGIDPATAVWEFHDRDAAGDDVVHRRSGLQTSYAWQSSGAHDVTFTVSDRAKNTNTYRFAVFVEDSVRPDVKFGLKPPEPGARRMRIVVTVTKSVRVRLLVTQAGRKGVLLRRFVSFWGKGTHSRSVPLRGSVGKGLLVVSGAARDLAGNTTLLPQCTVDPVSGQGACTSP